MLLSDRDILAEIASGRVVLEPYDEAMIQPSSIDVRLDKFFRVFDNHKYAAIDPDSSRWARTSLLYSTQASSCWEPPTSPLRFRTTSPHGSKASRRSAGS